MSKKPARPSTLNHLSAALMVRCLLDGPASVHDIVHETGVGYCTVRRYVAAMRSKKCIHVAAWETDTMNRRTVRAYLLGEGKDVAKPPLPSRSERERMRRKTKRMQTAALARAMNPAAPKPMHEPAL